MAPAKEDARQGAKAISEDKISQLFFDMAEAMENGGGRGLISSSALPPGPQDTVEDASKDRKLTILSNKEQGWRKLVDSEGATLLIAKPADEGRRFNIYVSRTARRPLAPRPLFSRSFSLAAAGRDRREWVLSSLFCERCETRGRRTCGTAVLAKYRCRTESAAAGAAFGMDVELPALTEDGIRASTCTICGDPGASWSTELTTRAPRPKGKSLELERTGMSLASCGGLSRGPCLCVDRVAEDKASLLYDAPLGVLQAFAASLLVSL